MTAVRRALSDAAQRSHLRRELENHVCHAGAAIERVWIQPSGGV
jgi:hypothetical protein